MARVVVPKVYEFTLHPWYGGVLAINGVQYQTPVNTVAAATNVVINTMPFGVIDEDYPAGGRGAMKECEIGMTIGLKARESANAIMQFFLQGRNDTIPTVTWVDLSSVELNIPGTTRADVHLSGRAALQTNFNTVPFQIRAQYQCNQTNEGFAQIKSSSFVRFVYEVA